MEAFNVFVYPKYDNKKAVLGVKNKKSEKIFHCLIYICYFCMRYKDIKVKTNYIN